MRERTFDGTDGLHTTMDPSSSEAISDDPVLEPKHKIFLSHSGAQKEFVDRLCKALEARCHYPFCDRRPESLPKGKTFPDLIIQAAQQCELFVVVASEEYFMSKWPMIELNAFVKATDERKSYMNRGILPLFYKLSLRELEDEKKRQRWFEAWKTFPREDVTGLINVDDWKYALRQLTMFDGLEYGRELKQVVKFGREWKQVMESENQIVSHICKFLTPDIKRGISSLLWDAVDEFAGLSDDILVTFPTSVRGPVRIEDKDLQSLQPKRHLSIGIVDFYIKYLEDEFLSYKNRNRFFFFNCSFFTGILRPKSPDDDYEQVRQWIRGVNLFENNYIFIPVHRSERWSLIIIICHLNSLTESPLDAHYRSPCIFHLDSGEGNDDLLAYAIRRFMVDSCTDIHENSDILEGLVHMKYVEVKVPEEVNGYDSGIYLLHYVELFIHESASPDFSFDREQGKSHFSGWDTSEVLAKRKHIQNLIFRLSGMSQLQGALRLHSSEIFSWLEFKAASEGRIEDVQNSDRTMINGEGAESEHGGHQTGGLTVLSEHQPFDVTETLTSLREDTRVLQAAADRLPQMEEIRGLPQAEESLLQAGNDTLILRKESDNRRPRQRNWSSAETSVLLESVVRFDSFPQGTNATRWDVIAGAVNRGCRSTRDVKQCRARFDTLCKAFKQVDRFCKACAKEFSEITEEERRSLKLPTNFKREWYTLMAQHYTNTVNYRKSGKRPSDCPTNSSAEIQIEAPAGGPSSPRIDTDSLPSSSAGEFQSEILPEPPPASPINRHDGTPVPESLVTTDPRPLVQRKKIRRDENETKGVYRRVVRDSDGAIIRFSYEPRFKPPRDINPAGQRVIHNHLSLGGYSTLQDAKDVRQIAAYYYGQSDRRLDLGDGSHFLIPDCDPVELQSLRGKEKAIWVTRKAKEVFGEFQMEKAGRSLADLLED